MDVTILFLAFHSAILQDHPPKNLSSVSSLFATQKQSSALNQAINLGCPNYNPLSDGRPDEPNKEQAIKNNTSKEVCLEYTLIPLKPMDISEHADMSSGHLSSTEFCSPESAVTSNEKEALMRMIAQEMVKAFVDPLSLEEDDMDLQERLEKTIRQQRRRTKRKSRRRSQPALRIPESVNDCGESFFGLALEDPVVKTSSRSKRRSSNEAKKRQEKKELDLSNSQNKTDDTSILEDELSIDEIRKYVLNNIPQAVREQIPEAAWSKIFGGETTSGEGSGVSRKSLEEGKRASSRDTSSTRTPKGLSGEIAVHSDADDDISVVSGLTSAFPDGKSVESKLASLTETKPTSETTRPTVLAEVSEDSSMISIENDAKEASNKSNRPARPKGVAFDKVELRYYERIPTDNPAVLNGPAIGLGWRYKRGGRIKLDAWESKRGPPLKSWELVMDRTEREGILINAGFSKKEIADTVRACLKGKNQRQQTVNNLPVSGVEEAVEKAQRKIARVMRFGKKKSILR
eukprot:scaffold22748_cov182-Cylindrotheca_fusiformis.AAC.6